MRGSSRRTVGRYFDLIENGMPVRIEAAPGIEAGDMQEFLRKRRERKAPCSVCALGACLVALVEREDDYNLDPHEEFRASARRMVKRLEAYFPEQMIAEIECAFERTSDCPSAETRLRNALIGSTKWDRMRKRFSVAAQQFVGIYEPNERLRAIMDRIIENGGEYLMPPDPLIPVDAPAPPPG